MFDIVYAKDFTDSIHYVFSSTPSGDVTVETFNSTEDSIWYISEESSFNKILNSFQTPFLFKTENGNSIFLDMEIKGNIYTQFEEPFFFKTKTQKLVAIEGYNLLTRVCVTREVTPEEERLLYIDKLTLIEEETQL